MLKKRRIMYAEETQNNGDIDIDVDVDIVIVC